MRFFIQIRIIIIIICIGCDTSRPISTASLLPQLVAAMRQALNEKDNRPAHRIALAVRLEIRPTETQQAGSAPGSQQLGCWQFNSRRFTITAWDICAPLPR